MGTYTYRCTNTDCRYIVRLNHPVRRVVDEQSNTLYPGAHRRHTQPGCKKCDNSVELLHREG